MPHSHHVGAAFIDFVANSTVECVDQEDVDERLSSDLLRAPKRHVRCAYIKCCYLADALSCYGFKADCALYRSSNGEFCSQEEFDEAMNTLIDQVRIKSLGQ